MALHSEFFGITAALIPPMAITLLVEQKFLSLRSGHTPRTKAEHAEYRRLLLMVNSGLIMAVAGEGAALLAVASTPNVADAVIVVLALMVLAILLVIPFMRLMLKEFAVSKSERSIIRRVRSRMTAYSCVTVTITLGIAMLFDFIYLTLFRRR